jgi:hypothetical protein
MGPPCLYVCTGGAPPNRHQMCSRGNDLGVIHLSPSHETSIGTIVASSACTAA